MLAITEKSNSNLFCHFSIKILPINSLPCEDPLKDNEWHSAQFSAYKISPFFLLFVSAKTNKGIKIKDKHVKKIKKNFFLDLFITTNIIYKIKNHYFYIGYK